MYLLWGIGDIIEDYPRVVQFVLNRTISRWPLRPPLGCTKVDVTVDLLLLNIRDVCEDVAVTVGVSRIYIPNPLINIIKRSQHLIPLPRHPVLCSGVKVRMSLHVPKVVRKYADRNFTLNICIKITFKLYWK